MSFNLKNRNFLKLEDFTPQEIQFLLRLSTELKAAKYARTETQSLQGKQIALVLRKTQHAPVVLLRLPQPIKVHTQPILVRVVHTLVTKSR